LLNRYRTRRTYSLQRARFIISFSHKSKNSCARHFGS